MWYVTCFVVGFGLGGWLWPKARLHLLAFRNDPIGIIRADIAKLEAKRRSLLGG